jgi:hypothetical protein
MGAKLGHSSLREENELRVLENKGLKQFGPNNAKIKRRVEKII